MSKTILALKITSFILYGIALAISVFFLCYYRGGEKSLYATIYTFLGLGLLEVIVLLIRVLEKDIIKSLTSYVHVAYMVTSLICYYVLRYVGHYEEFIALYWILYLALTLIAVVVFVILNFKIKKNGSNITRKRL